MNPKLKQALELVGLAFAIMFIVLAIVFRDSLNAPRVTTISPVASSSNVATSVQNPIAPIEKVVLQALPIDYKGEKVAPSNTAKLPDSTRFESFSYNASVGKQVNITSTCNDAYYSILIFSEKDDYKKNPAAAKINSSYACPTNHIAVVKFNISDFNLPTGQYYLFIADQGASGTWYNPR